jgi:hypothetical protein
VLASGFRPEVVSAKSTHHDHKRERMAKKHWFCSLRWQELNKVEYLIPCSKAIFCVYVNLWRFTITDQDKGLVVVDLIYIRNICYIVHWIRLSNIKKAKTRVER